MRPSKVEVLDFSWQKPGVSRLKFRAQYPGYIRRGTVVYDAEHRRWLSHTKDVSLLAAVCLAPWADKGRKNDS